MTGLVSTYSKEHNKHRHHHIMPLKSENRSKYNINMNTNININITFGSFLALLFMYVLQECGVAILSVTDTPTRRAQ